MVCDAALVWSQSWVRQAPPFAAIAFLFGFPDLHSFADPRVTDLRIARWSPLQVTPSPMLRLVLTDSEMKAALVLWWSPVWRSSTDVPDPGVRCDARGEGPQTCAQLVPLTASLDWRKVADGLLAAGPCSAPDVGGVPRPPAPADSAELRVQMSERGRYREYVCRDPRNQTGPGVEPARRALELLRELSSTAKRPPR